MSTLQLTHIGADVVAYLALATYFARKVASLEARIDELEADRRTTVNFIADAYNASASARRQPTSRRRVEQPPSTAELGREPSGRKRQRTTHNTIELAQQMERERGSTD